MYTTDKALSNTLYGGDRAGSRYYYVLENTAATETAQKDSGLINPGFKNKVTAMQVNPFVKFRGLELFGVIERAEGKASTEADRTRPGTSTRSTRSTASCRTSSCSSAPATTRRTASSPASPATSAPNRWQVGGGWFITPSLLAKAEYVNQKYFGYPATNIKNGGKFKGFMLEGVVAF